MSNEQHKVLLTAADFFNQSARKALSIDGRLHAETLIISVARMAGSLMYRTFGFKAIEPGTAVLSDQANAHGPKLMHLMFVTLQQLGDKVSEQNLNGEYASAKSSLLTFKESHERLAPIFLKYCEVGPMPLYDAAMGAAIATGILVHDCRAALSVEKGAAIAVYGFVEGTKTAPFPLSPVRSSTSIRSSDKKRPWYKLW
jgi:hypothetical protein